MSPFLQAAPAHQSALMVFVFLSLVLCIFNFFALSYRSDEKKRRVLNCVLFLLLFTLDANFGNLRWNRQADTPARDILPLPMAVLWGLAALALALLIAECVHLLRSRKETLQRDAIKQAIDTLPSACCYFDPDGAVKLCNRKMHELFRTLAQSDLQTLPELHAALENCDDKNGMHRLLQDRQTYLFPDGKAWRYAENIITASDGVCYTEALFTDVTRLCLDTQECLAQTEQLAQLSHALDALSLHAPQAAREQELLTGKTRLHDRMGSGVLAIRCILQSGKTDEAAYALDMFRRAVRMIETKRDTASQRDTEMAEFIHDAKTIGVQVHMSGALPAEQAAAQIFLLAMRECLTNAVRHAGASELYLSLLQNSQAYILQLSNNGTVPKEEIVAKGGLKNLERSVLAQRGRLCIQSFPAFRLTLSLPLSQEDANK